MTETLKLIVTKFTDEAITITSLVLLFVLVVLVVYWLYNRRKFRQLTHQIPASVVKNYLDSIIQNSSSLKSSLFRGGGLEMGEGIPSVMPLKDLPAGNISVGTGDSEALNQKIAELNSLKTKLSDKDRVITELEKRLESGAGNIDSDAAEQAAIYKKEVSSLQEKLKLKDDEIKAARAAAAAGAGGDNSDLEARLEALSKERDDMRERLAEYEIIEEDLANLKRLQQENEQLKNELDKLRGGSAPAETPAPVSEEEVAEPVVEEEEDSSPEPEIVSEPEEEVEVEQEADVTAEDAAAVDEFENMISDSGEEEQVAAEESSAEEEPKGKEAKGEQRSAEELLSEFEKMLG